MKFKSFVTNKQKELEGVWVQVPGSDLELKVARMTNPHYETFLRKVCAPFRSLIQQNKMPTERMNALMMQAVSHHVLLDWKNLEADDGTQIPYSQAKALELMSQSNDFFKLVIDFANDADLYRDEESEALKGN